MKRKTLIIIIVALVVVFVALYAYRNKKIAQAPAPIPMGPEPPPTTTPKPAANDNFPLVKGSVGDNVKYLQMAINKINPSANLTTDGNFGDKTYTQLLLTIGASYYPVTQPRWLVIVQRANRQ